LRERKKAHGHQSEKNGPSQASFLDLRHPPNLVHEAEYVIDVATLCAGEMGESTTNASSI
jgi:hypothetical protein